jgi:hypothetical protein
MLQICNWDWSMTSQLKYWLENQFQNLVDLDASYHFRVRRKQLHSTKQFFGQFTGYEQRKLLIKQVHFHKKRLSKNDKQ